MKSKAILLGLFTVLSLLTIAGRVEKVYHFANPEVKHTGTYQLVNLENTMLTALPGQPVLPYRQVNLMLPPGEKAVSIEIIFSNEQILPGTFNLYPQQEVHPISTNGSGNFIKDAAIYNQNTVFPANPKGQLITSFLNGRSFALSSFTPARYNPATGHLSYYATAQVIIHTEGDEKAFSALNNLATTSRQAEKLADNSEMETLYQTFRKPLTTNYDLLIISPSEFAASFAGMQANYLKEGITSLVVTRDSIAAAMTGTDLPEKIRNFIIQEYQTHGIQYVTLAGDDEQIPHRGFYCSVISGSGYTDQNIPADLYYSALDGNWNSDGDALWGEPGEDDLLPDIAVARLTFSNTSELANMLNKSYKYQFTPIAGEFRNVLMAGENLWSNPDTWGSDYLELLKGEHSDNGYSTVGIPVDYAFDHLYDENIYWSAQDLMDHLNQGKPMLNHVGHANENFVMKLDISDVTNANFHGLNGADHNYTIVYTHGCYCGAFDYNDCIAEKMVNINNFAAAFIGNSRYGWFNEGQTEGPSAHLHREYMDALYTDSLNRIGRAHMESKIATASWVTAPGQWEPGALRWCFYDCNVLGDAALAVFTDNPVSINTTFPTTVLTGADSMNVNVSSDGEPAYGLTCVAMKNGSTIGKAITDINGDALIIFDFPVSDPGDAELIISGYNCTPTTYNFAFVPVSGPFIVYAHSLVNDPSGNLNNQPDYGETISLTNGMRNIGGSDATEVLVTLITDDPYITISDSSALYSLIPAGDTVTLINAFTFIISDTIPDGHQVNFTLKAVSGETWFSDFAITCYAPVLATGALIIGDSGSGNANGRLDPGETVTFIIPSLNNGNSTSINATGTLTSTSPWVTIQTPVNQLGNIASGTLVNAEFVALISSDVPVASVVELEYHLAAGGYQASTSYLTTVRLIVEDFESGNFAHYPWTTLGQYPWQINSELPLEGVYCSKSATIGDSKQSEMSISLNVIHTDSISFYTKVSSEEDADQFQFFIDLQLQNEWSGTLPWQKHIYAVTAGVHTFKWVYAKNSSIANGNDCAWVDFIVFPEFVDYTGVNEPIEEKPALILTPNPVKDMMAVHVSLKKQCIYRLAIYNNEGKTVISNDAIHSDNKGQSDLKLDVSDLKPGYYICEIISGNIKISRTFIVY